MSELTLNSAVDYCLEELDSAIQNTISECKEDIQHKAKVYLFEAFQKLDHTHDVYSISLDQSIISFQEVVKLKAQEIVDSTAGEQETVFNILDLISHVRGLTNKINKATYQEKKESQLPQELQEFTGKSIQEIIDEILEWNGQNQAYVNRKLTALINAILKFQRIEVPAASKQNKISKSTLNQWKGGGYVPDVSQKTARKLAIWLHQMINQ